MAYAYITTTQEILHKQPEYKTSLKTRLITPVKKILRRELPTHK